MRIRLKTWSTQGLKAGDLTALTAVANGSQSSEAERIKRLAGRGFVARERDGKVSVTFRGRAALIIRRILLPY